MQDFTAFVREQAKNITTKRLQPDQPYKKLWSSHKQKNPGSAATETGINSIVKAFSFLELHNILRDRSSSGEVRQ